jgi:hypothetical protein
MRTYTSVEGALAAGDVADDYYRQPSPPPAPAAWLLWTRSGIWRLGASKHRNYL